MYTIVFDAISDSYLDVLRRYPGLFLLLAPSAVIGVKLVLLKNRNVESVKDTIYRFANRSSKFFSLFVVSLLFLGVFIIQNIILMSEHSELKRLYKNNEYKIVEGKVGGLKVVAKHVRGKETFYVSGVKFLLRNSNVTVFYHKTVVYGGIFKSGRRVRIYYLPNTRDDEHAIFRVEIDKSSINMK